MADLPPISGPLIRYVGRLVSNKTAAEWRALGEEGRTPYFKQARTLLNAERRFLSKAQEADATRG